jgi:hypothetical protein
MFLRCDARQTGQGGESNADPLAAEPIGALARARARRKEIRTNLLIFFDADFESRGITGGASGSALISSIDEVRSGKRIGREGEYVLVSFQIKTRLALIDCNPGYRSDISGATGDCDQNRRSRSATTIGIAAAAATNSGWSQAPRRRVR